MDTCKKFFLRRRMYVPTLPCSIVNVYFQYFQILLFLLFLYFRRFINLVCYYDDSIFVVVRSVFITGFFSAAHFLSLFLSFLSQLNLMREIHVFLNLINGIMHMQTSSNIKFHDLNKVVATKGSTYWQ